MISVAELHVQFCDVCYIFLCMTIIALASLDFSNHSDNKWCATVGIHNNKVALYENNWTDDRHYICQYDRE